MTAQRVDDEPTRSLADAAAYYARKGWAVFPLHSPRNGACSCGRPDCSSPAKHPRTANGLKNATDDADQIAAWWRQWPDANIGLLTGVFFDVLDIDGDEGKASYAELLDTEGQLPDGPDTTTGGGGYHLLFQATGINNKAGWRTKLDWRGRGGYIVAPPSVHMSGNVYHWNGGPDEPLNPVPEWLQLILNPPRETRPHGATITYLPLDGQGTRYGLSALNGELDEISQAVEGTRNDRLNNSAFNLYSLVAAHQLDERVVDERVYAAAAAIGLPDSEIRQTMASAKKSGMESPREIYERPQNSGALALAPQPKPRPKTNEAPVDGEQPAEEEEIPTGWERVDLSPWLDGNPPDDTPKLCARLDGQMILYPGKVHSFNGEPESGKSWVAQFAAAQVLNDGGCVTYLDFEDSAGTVTGRMLALGCEIDAIRYRFYYHRLDQPFSFEAADVLDAALAEAEPALTVLDGVTEAMGLCGLNSYDNSDVAKFWRMIPRRLSATGSAAVLIDHVVKDSESRGRWAIGAQHKMAAIDGASFTVETLKPFGRGKCGLARVLVTKDRPGHLRQYATGNVLAEFKLDSLGPQGPLEAALSAPHGNSDTFRPTHLMERLSRYIEDNAGMTQRSILTAVKGDDKAKALSLEVLGAEGYISVQKQGQSKIHTSLRPYREEDEQHGSSTDEQI